MKEEGVAKQLQVAKTKRLKELDKYQYDRVLYGFKMLMRSLLTFVSADFGLVILASETGNGWASIIAKGSRNKFARMVALTPEAGSAFKALCNQGGKKIETGAINNFLTLLGEEPCKAALGWCSRLPDGRIVGLVLANKNEALITFYQLDHVITTLVEDYTDFVQNLGQRITDKRLLTHTLNCLLEVNKAILEGGSFETILEHILEEVRLVVGAKGAGLLLYDEDTESLVLQKPAFGSYNEGLINSYRVSLKDECNAVRVFQSRKPYFSNNAPEDPNFTPSLLQLFPAKNVISVPVMINNKCVGVMHVTNKPGSFSEDDVTVLKLLVSQLAVAIENARLMCRIRAEEAQSRSLFEISKEFRLLDVEPLITLAAKKILNVLPASLVAIALRDRPGWGKIIGQAGLETDWIGRFVPLSPVDLEIKDLLDTKEPLEQFEVEAVGLGMQTQITLAVKSGSEPLGNLLIWTNRRKSFSPSQTRFLSLVANQLAAALENVNLFEREKRMSERLQRFVKINERLLWLIVEGAGIQAITKNLAHYLNAGVVFYDHQLTRRASARVPKEKFAGLDTAFTRFVEEEGGTISSQMTYNEMLSQKAFIAPVRVGGDTLGYLCVLPEDQLDEDFQSVVQRTLPVYALELLKGRIDREVRQNIERDFVSALLEGKYSEEVILERAFSLGIELNLPYVVAVAEHTLESPRLEGSRKLQQPLFDEERLFLKQRLPDSIIVTLHGRLIMLVSCRSMLEGTEVESLMKVLEQLRQSVAMTPNRLAIGIGRIAKNMKDLESSYRDACLVVKYINQTRNKKEIMAFRDLGLYQALVEDNAASALANFAGDLLGPLLNMDKKRGTTYLKTLDCYFAEGSNIKAASAGLFCHANTVRYRLERIKQMLGLDLGNAEHAFNLQMGLKIAKFYYPELF